MDINDLKPVVRSINNTRIHPFDLAESFNDLLNKMNSITVPKDRKFTYLMENNRYDFIMENIRTQIKKFKKFKIFDIPEKSVKFLSNPESDDRKLQHYGIVFKNYSKKFTSIVDKLEELLGLT